MTGNYHPAIEIDHSTELRVLVEDVSGGNQSEFLSSIYGEELDLLAEGYGDNHKDAFLAGMSAYYDEFVLPLIEQEKK